MSDLQSAIDTLLDESAHVMNTSMVGGGCISNARQVSIKTKTGVRDVFVKDNSTSFLENFECESAGLVALADCGAIRVPRPLAVGLASGKAWLISEWIDEGSKRDSYYHKFGMQLAKLHRDTRGQEIGWQHDNYLGAAPQPNPCCDQWVDFVAKHRIEHQLRWAMDQGYRDPALEKDLNAIIRTMADLLDGRDDETSLLHGDLWSGNYLCDDSGQPVVIDPAVYRGCREAEFGMLKLFGACPTDFYRAYQTAWPMPEGWQRRTDIYVLYHLLNHLNLFGSGYLGQCKTLASSILSQV